METRKKRQEKRERHEKAIREHLLKYGTITEKQARDNYKMARAAPRILELRKKGFDIKTITGSFHTYYKLIKAA